MTRTTLATWAGIGVVLVACAGRTNLNGTPRQGNPLFVQDVLFPTPVAQGNQCTYSADPNQASLSSGMLDLAFRNEYTPTVIVGNQSEPATSTGGSPSDGVELQGARVRVEDSGGTQIENVITAASGFVYPGTADVAGYAPLAVTMLDATATASVGSLASGQVKRLVAHVTVLGTTRGGDQVQSDEFVFPVDLCDGCLVTFSPADIDPTLPEPNCVAGVAASTGGGVSSLPVPCIIGQDTPVDCIDCQKFPACHGAVGG